jgi:hypothetical protein
MEVKMSHEAIPVEAEPHAVTVGDKQAVVGVSDFKGRRFLEYRYLYTKVGGSFDGPGLIKWERGSNGVNIPLEDAEEALQVILATLGAYRGVRLVVTTDEGEEVV